MSRGKATKGTRQRAQQAIASNSSESARHTMPPRASVAVARVLSGAPTGREKRICSESSLCEIAVTRRLLAKQISLRTLSQ